jgi:hypothetical protein
MDNVILLFVLMTNSPLFDFHTLISLGTEIRFLVIFYFSINRPIFCILFLVSDIKQLYFNIANSTTCQRAYEVILSEYTNNLEHNSIFTYHAPLIISLKKPNL